MKITKILLRDDCDSHFTDLITFRRKTTRREVYEVVFRCKRELEGVYTNEDIYRYLDEIIGIKTIEFLDYDIIEY